MTLSPARVCLLCALMLFAACSAESDARGTASEEISERREATTPDFIEAYEAGFDHERARAYRESRRSRSGEGSVDVGFAERWRSLSSIDAPGLDAFVTLGDADAWLDGRYRDLGIVQRDLAAANALFFLASWEAFNGTSAERVQSDGVRRQIEALLEANPVYEPSSKIEIRRRTFELMAATLTRESQRVHASRDPAGIAAFADTVRSDFLRQTHNDLALFSLTGDGFQQR